ncbi:c-type cytochrome [Aequorivita viscosa]|nr:c-type cytochrome [Aequorivita viscosa]
MKLFVTLFLIILLGSCHNKHDGYLANAENFTFVEKEIQQKHPGKKLMENNCYSCHNPKTSEEQMMAPPMVAIKMHYISEDTSKEDFVNAMVAWSKNPSEEKSKMPGAVKKFGLMPYQFYPENTIRQIAEYMFENEVEEPEWFQAHYNKMHGDRPKLKGKNDE